MLYKESVTKQNIYEEKESIIYSHYYPSLINVNNVEFGQ